MRRLTALLLAVVAVLALAGCKNNTPKATSSPGGTSTGAETEPVAAPIEKGTYSYQAYGIHATIKPDGDQWSLTVKNNTGHNLGKPALYAEDSHDGHQIDATLEGSEPLANGKEVTLPITWDLPSFNPPDIGLVILEFGDENFGAFAYGG